MLLRSALGMAIVMMLMGMAQNIWQFLLLRALLGLLGGFIPNANALIATQIPRHKSGWALGTLSTGAVSGALLGPLAGGFLADHWGLRTVFFMTAAVLFICFLLTLFLIRENFVPIARKEMLSAREVFSSLQNPKLVLSLFVTSLIIQVATGSIAPILTLYVRDLAGNVSNIAFISGMIASVPGIAALMSAPRLGKLGDRIGPEKILIVALIISVLLLIPMSFVQTPLQLGILRFLLGAADGALLPAVQTLLVYNSTSQISGRIFSYNQSFRDIGNVTGPLIGASVSANYGFRAVFLVTAGVVLFNAIYSTLSLPSASRGYFAFSKLTSRGALSLDAVRTAFYRLNRVQFIFFSGDSLCQRIRCSTPRLKKLLMQHVKNFSPTTLTAMKRAPTLSSSTFKSMCCRMAISPGQAEFFADEEEQGECLPMLSGEAAQSVFDGDYDEIELRQEWLEENTLHEWDEGEFQLEPSLDTEEGQTAADEWDER